MTSNDTAASDTWAGMSAEQRAQRVQAANCGSLALTARWGYQRRVNAMGVVAASEIEVIEPSEDFLAVSGASVASVATAAPVGRIAIPEIVRAGDRLSITAGGTIGVLIPPSILMIINGIIAETSVTKVFVGGLTIGILTAISHALVVLLIRFPRPDVIPPSTRAEAGECARVFVSLLPISALVLPGSGRLFSGLFTATEAGAVSALGTVILAAVTSKLTARTISRSLTEAITTTEPLLIIRIGAMKFRRFFGLSGLQNLIPRAVAGADLGSVGLMPLNVAIYLILGTFTEPFGAMLETLPVCLPVLEAEDVSPVWFGVLVVKRLEIGMITPPVGLKVFVIRNVAAAHMTTAQVFTGAVPFIRAAIVVVALVIAVPGVALLLPDLL